jgi:pyruvate dehydrogenase E2 component (dihydrolipoamide acetyltransferase)
LDRLRALSGIFKRSDTMATDIKLPGLGDGIDSGDVLEIYVKEGDVVTKEQSLIELETDKATVTVPSPAAGKISKLMVKLGETVAIGAVIAQLESSDAPPAAAVAPQAAAPPAEVAKVEPQAQAPSGPPPAPKPTPAPAQAQPTAPTPPVAPAVAPVAAQPSAAQPSAPQPSAAQPSAPQESTASSFVAASPAVRRFAREVGVDLTTVAGTGDSGRITRDDVLRAVREISSRPTQVASPSNVGPQGSLTHVSAPVAAPVGGNRAIALPGDPSQDDYGPVRVERLSKIRKTIANQMHKSWSTVPRVTNFDDADVTDLEAFRATSKDDYAAQGIKLTTMPFLIKAVATALRMHPTMNALIDMENDQITYRDYVNLGIAVDTERGLVVPNIRHADSLSIPSIAKALADLAARVRGGEFGVNELRGGTFTISNLGAIGGTYSTPIVNVPEVAILLVGRTRKLPVVMEDDSIQPRQMMPLSLSYDHRLVDGGTAARFLNDVIAYLEAPSRLLLAIT